MAYADARMRPHKATLEQLRRHNRSLVLRALYSGAAESRAELAGVTGLTKPTISNLITELLAEGLVSEAGPGRSSDSGGKRPTLLQFEPGAYQVIGVTVSGSRVLGVLSNLAGVASALHLRDLPGAGRPGMGAVEEVVNGLLPQLDAPLLCIGVGLPGSVDAWLAEKPLTVVTALEDAFGVPVHLANQAELCALGQLAFAEGAEEVATSVTLMVEDSVEIGVCLAGGRFHYGSDLSDTLLCRPAATITAAEAFRWRRVEARARELAAEHPGTRLDADGLSYLRLRAAAAQGDEAAEALIGELARTLAPLLASIVATLRPGLLSLGGPLSDLGGPFLDRLRAEAERLLPPEQLAEVLLDVTYSGQVGAMGAVALAIQGELELVTA